MPITAPTAIFTKDAVAEWVGLHYRVNYDAEPEAKRRLWDARFLDSHFEEGALYGAVTGYREGFCVLVHPDYPTLLRGLADVLFAGQDDFVCGLLSGSAEAFVSAAATLGDDEAVTCHAAVKSLLHFIQANPEDHDPHFLRYTCDI